jgi:hypothetical protein
MASITLSPETEAIVKEYAEKRGITLTESGNRLVHSGHKRLVAIHKYADANKPAKKPRAKKEKAAKPAKAPKAKGPLARKMESKAKAPRVRKAKAKIAAVPDAAPESIQ